MSASRALFYAGTVLQILTCPIHLTGFLVERVPANEQEKLLLDLMRNYTLDLGAGFVRSTRDLFVGLSLQYSIFMLMVGAMNWLAIRRVKDSLFLRRLSWLNAFFMGIFAVNACVHLFLPPLLLFVLPAFAFGGGRLDRANVGVTKRF